VKNNKQNTPVASKMQPNLQCTEDVYKTLI